MVDSIVSNHTSPYNRLRGVRMVSLFGMLLGSGMAFGPALYNAFPIWHVFVDFMCNTPGMVDACLNVCNVANSPALNTLFEMIFS